MASRERHEEIIAAGLAFAREKGLWPARERHGLIMGVYQAPTPDSRRLENHMDIITAGDGLSGGEFQMLMGEIVRRRLADPGAPTFSGPDATEVRKAIGKKQPGLLSRLASKWFKK